MPYKSKLFAVISVLGLAVSFRSFGSDQDLYFHLHQTYSFLEAFAKGHCLTFPEQSKQHLVDADKTLGKANSILETELHEIWRLYNLREGVNLQRVEQVRDNVQSKADSLKLKHHKEWHGEIKKVCISSTE